MVVRLLIRGSRLLSRRAAVILFNSFVAQKQHIPFGYPRGKCRVIPNGFDTALFRPHKEARTDKRKAWSIPDGALVIGNIARYHPMKNHVSLIKAFSRCLSAWSDCPLYLVMAGRLVTADNDELMSAVHRARVQENVRLLGPVDNPENSIPAFDIYCSPSSWGEGFPNVLGEAMSCGVPCVTTDVGDSAAVIDGTGFLTEGTDAKSIAAGLSRMIELGQERRHHLGTLARKRIIENYSISTIVDRYEQLYAELSKRT